MSVASWVSTVLIWLGAIAMTVMLVQWCVARYRKQPSWSHRLFTGPLGLPLQVGFVLLLIFDGIVKDLRSEVILGVVTGIVVILAGALELVFPTRDQHS